MSANQELTRTKALAAAASVVLASVSGCAGKNTPPPATTDSTGAQAPAHTRSHALATHRGGGRAPHQDVCGPAGDIGACCTALHEACAEALVRMDRPTRTACTGRWRMDRRAAPPGSTGPTRHGLTHRVDLRPQRPGTARRQANAHPTAAVRPARMPTRPMGWTTSSWPASAMMSTRPPASSPP